MKFNNLVREICHWPTQVATIATACLALSELCDWATLIGVLMLLGAEVSPAQLRRARTRVRVDWPPAVVRQVQVFESFGPRTRETGLGSFSGQISSGDRTHTCCFSRLRQTRPRISLLPPCPLACNPEGHIRRAHPPQVAAVYVEGGKGK